MQGCRNAWEMRAPTYLLRSSWIKKTFRADINKTASSGRHPWDRSPPHRSKLALEGPWLLFLTLSITFPNLIRVAQRQMGTLAATLTTVFLQNCHFHHQSLNTQVSINLTLTSYQSDMLATGT